MTDIGLDLDDTLLDPFDQFDVWFRAAAAHPVSQPEAMTLATVDDEGHPDARTVLLRRVIRQPEPDAGFHFFTNYMSSKGLQLALRPDACLLFHWEPMARQVRIRGAVHILPPAASDAYFATRPRGSQIGAWASPQSTVIAARSDLDRRVAEIEARFASGPVPRPAHWGGFTIVARTIEFWQGRTFRLHDRIRYRFEADIGTWVRERLAP